MYAFDFPMNQWCHLLVHQYAHVLQRDEGLIILIAKLPLLLHGFEFVIFHFDMRQQYLLVGA